MSSFPCSLITKMTSHIVKNLAFHRGGTLTTSLIYTSLYKVGSTCMYFLNLVKCTTAIIPKVGRMFVLNLEVKGLTCYTKVLIFKC